MKNTMKMTLATVLVAMTAMTMATSASARTYTTEKSYDLYDVYHGVDNKCLVLQRISGTETVGNVTTTLGVSDKKMGINFVTGNRITVNAYTGDIVVAGNNLLSSNVSYSTVFNGWNINYSTKTTGIVNLYPAGKGLVDKFWHYTTPKGTRVDGYSTNTAYVIDCN